MSKVKHVWLLFFWFLLQGYSESKGLETRDVVSASRTLTEIAKDCKKIVGTWRILFSVYSQVGTFSIDSTSADSIIFEGLNETDTILAFSPESFA